MFKKKILSQFEAFRIIYLNIDKSLLHVRKETDYPEEFFLQLSIVNYWVAKYYAFLLGAGNTVEEWMSTPIISM